MTTIDFKKDDCLRPATLPTSPSAITASSSFLHKLFSRRKTPNNRRHASTPESTLSKTGSSASESDDFDDQVVKIDTKSLLPLDPLSPVPIQRGHTEPIRKSNASKQRMTAQSTSEYHQMIAHEISKRIQSVVPTASQSQSTDDPALAPRRKSFWVGDSSDRQDDSGSSETGDDEDDEEDEEEDFWSLPMGDPVRPFAVANRYTRARGSSPKVPDLGTVREEEEEDEAQADVKTVTRFEAGSHFPPILQKSPKKAPSSPSSTSSHAYISRYPIVSLPRKRPSLESVSLNSPLTFQRASSPLSSKAGKGDVRKLFELGPLSPAEDKENELAARKELPPPSVCLVSPEEEGNVSVILHQHDPIFSTYSSRDSIASLILKNPGPVVSLTKGLLFDYDDQDDQSDEATGAMIAARRGGIYLDTADTESDSDSDIEMQASGDPAERRALPNANAMEVYVFQDTPDLEDTFETPRPPSKIREARRVSLTISTSRTQTLEQEPSSIERIPRRDVEKMISASPTSSTSTVVYAASIVRPSGPGMWRQSYGAGSVASEEGDQSIGAESRTSGISVIEIGASTEAFRREDAQVLRDSTRERESMTNVTTSLKTPPGERCNDATEADATTRGSPTSPPASSASSVDVETPTTPKAVLAKVAFKPDVTVIRHRDGDRADLQQAVRANSWNSAFGTLDRASVRRQEVMLTMGIDRPCPSSRNQQLGSASLRVTTGASLRRKSLRNIFGASVHSRGPENDDRDCNERIHMVHADELGHRSPSVKRSMPALSSAATIDAATPAVAKPLTKKFSLSSLSRAFRWPAKFTSVSNPRSSHMPSVTSGPNDDTGCDDRKCGRENTFAEVTRTETAREGWSSFNLTGSAFASPVSTVAENMSGEKELGRSPPNQTVSSPPPKVIEGPARKLTFSSVLPVAAGQRDIAHQPTID